LTFQDSNGRLILSDQQIGWTFYFLGYFDIVNDRTADAQQRLRKSLAYNVKARPPVIWAIQPTFHLLFRSLWEQINNPETDKLTEIFWIMLGMISGKDSRGRLSIAAKAQLVLEVQLKRFDVELLFEEKTQL
jgi:hypothetical protein